MPLSAHPESHYYQPVTNRLLLLVPLVYLAACQTSNSRAVEEAGETRRVIEQRITAWARLTAAGHIDSVADMFATDAWEVDPNNRPVTGRAAIVTQWRRSMAMGRWDFAPHVEEVIVRDSIAIERSRYTLQYTAQTGVAGPPSFEGQGSWVNVWRREPDGQWRILWTIASTANAPERK